MKYNKLLYKRQFIISASSKVFFDNWLLTKIDDKYYISSHPDLQTTVIEKNNTKLICLGYILDPYNPNLNNFEIVKNLLKLSTNIDELVDNTFSLSGRFILIYKVNDELFIFNDPSGLRIVFYTNNRDHDFYCSSQPGLISSLLNIDYSDAANEFLGSSYYHNNGEFWYPSGVSFYQEISHLVPNHYLCVNKREQIRFFPKKKKKECKPEQVIDKCSLLLKNTIQSAMNRYQLALTITAGLDSRVIFAASKEMKVDIYYFTSIYYDLNYKSHDIAIPSAMLKYFGIKHNIIDCSQEMDSDFKSMYLKNVVGAHEIWGNIVFGKYKYLPKDIAIIKGDGSEIARNNTYKNIDFNQLDGHYFANMTGMKNIPFCVSNFDKWWKKSKDVIANNNYEVSNIFCWEQIMGNWLAISQLESDIVNETITPFNNRELLCLLLSVNKKYRYNKYNILYKKIIKNLWSSSLEFPINPISIREKIKKRIKFYSNFIKY